MKEQVESLIKNVKSLNGWSVENSSELTSIYYQLVAIIKELCRLDNVRWSAVRTGIEHIEYNAMLELKSKAQRSKVNGFRVAKEQILSDLEEISRSI